MQIFSKKDAMFILFTVTHFQMENLKKAASEDDKKRQEDKKQADVYESHSKFMKSKVSTIRNIYRVVKISWQPAHFTGYFEYCVGYSEC